MSNLPLGMGKKSNINTTIRIRMTKKERKRRRKKWLPKRIGHNLVFFLYTIKKKVKVSAATI